MEYYIALIWCQMCDNFEISLECIAKWKKESKTVYSMIYE